MDIEEWNRRYLRSIDFAEKKMPEVKGVIAAYNSNIDAIIHVRTDDIDRILTSDVELRQSFRAKLRKPKNEVSTKEDLFVGLFKCVERGVGEEWIIKDEGIFNWIESTFECDRFLMGGQAGNIANTLAKLNVPNVIVHAASLPEVQASLFFENVKIPTRRNGRVILESPMKAVRLDDVKMVHYVFEFEKGTTLRIDGHRVESPRANRFVATWDPKNTELEIDPAFPDWEVRDKADRAVLSGFHLLTRDYEDGSTHVDKIMRAVKQARSWKEKDPKFFIHLEVGDNKYKEIYASTLTLLSSFIDSIGLNETEILKAISSLGIEAPDQEEPFSSVTAFESARMILDTLDVSSILVHTLDFSLCTIKKGKNRPARRREDIRDAIMFGALLAAVRAVTAKYNSISKVKKEANNPLFFISPEGMREHEHLADYLEASYSGSPKEFLNRGYVELQDCYVIFAASKLTVKPATTAGLGDSLISGYILGAK